MHGQTMPMHLSPIVAWYAPGNINYHGQNCPPPSNTDTILTLKHVLLTEVYLSVTAG